MHAEIWKRDGLRERVESDPNNGTALSAGSRPQNSQVAGLPGSAHGHRRDCVITAHARPGTPDAEHVILFQVKVTFLLTDSRQRPEIMTPGTSTSMHSSICI